MTHSWHFSEDLFRRALANRNCPDTRTIVTRTILDSTSTELIEMIRKGAEPGTLVIAGAQRSGRGRRGRRWHSPSSGNLYLSVAVSLDGSPNKSLRYVPLAAGIAAVDTVREAGVPRAELKWPNDILAGGRKLGGILCEVPDMSRRPIHVVVGLGLNTGPAEFPEELEQTAASFANFSDIEPNLEITAASWVARFEKQMVRLNDGDLKEIIAAWRRRAEPFGRRVRTDNITGTTVDLDGEGQLLIRLDNGDIKAISGGIVEGI